MSYNSKDNSAWAIKRRKKLEIREKILKRHQEGTLPRGYYKRDKKTGKRYLSPHKLEEMEELQGV